MLYGMLTGMDYMAVGALLLAAGILIGLAVGVAMGRSGRGSSAGAQVAALLAPAAEAMSQLQAQLREVERDRIGAYAGLREQVAGLHRASSELGAQTRSLLGALRAPQIRGRWGEVQLQRVVELAGMTEHCDFDTQVSAPGRDGIVRPDLVVHLGGGRHIPVDAKVPFASWLQAQDEPDERRRAGLLAAHARALRGHVDALAGKAYWSAFQPAPEFVVLFIPGEPLLDAALAAEPSLTDYAFARKVVIATPTTLIALLRTVAFTWRQERLSESAAAIHALGGELYGRLSTLGGHLDRMGTSLEHAVGSYNAAVRCVESRVLVTARRFADLGVSADALPELDQVERAVRRPQAPELLESVRSEPDRN